MTGKRSREAAEGGSHAPTAADGEDEPWGKVWAGEAEPKPSADSSGQQGFTCGVEDCEYYCRGIAEFEAHYNAAHRYVCQLGCGAFPSAEALDRHLSSSHGIAFPTGTGS
eukprot:RCo030659